MCLGASFTIFHGEGKGKTLPITFRKILLVRLIPHAKYTRMVYPYIPVSNHYFNPNWPSYKPIKAIELFTNSYLLRGGYCNLYMFHRSVCDTTTSVTKLWSNELHHPIDPLDGWPDHLIHAQWVLSEMHAQKTITKCLHISCPLPSLGVTVQLPLFL